ncbi:MAG: hypothetical protein AB7V43_18415 [Acidimicrobiia bacterium]
MAGRIREVLSNRRSRRFVGVGSAVVLASTLGVINYVNAAPIAGPSSLFVPVSPERILDTRPAPDGPIGVPSAAPLVGNNGACTPTELQITGATTGVPTNATAVVLNVTVTRPDKDSVLTIWPTGLPMPRVSNMNWVINRTIANLVTVQLGSGGRVSFCNYNGNVDVIADIAGYYVVSTGTVGPAGPQGPAGTPGAAGTPGTPGATILSGAGAPSGGADGDFYFRTSNGTLYGPKAAGAWPGSGTSLVGPAGTNGTSPTVSPATTGTPGTASSTATCATGTLIGGYYTISGATATDTITTGVSGNVYTASVTGTGLVTAHASCIA